MCSLPLCAVCAWFTKPNQLIWVIIWESAVFGGVLLSGSQTEAFSVREGEQPSEERRSTSWCQEDGISPAPRRHGQVCTLTYSSTHQMLLPVMCDRSQCLACREIFKEWMAWLKRSITRVMCSVWRSRDQAGWSWWWASRLPRARTLTWTSWEEQQICRRSWISTSERPHMSWQGSCGFKKKTVVDI